MDARFSLLSALKMALTRRRDRLAVATVAFTAFIGSACEVLTIICISTASLKLVGTSTPAPEFSLVPSMATWTVFWLVVAGVVLIVVRLMVMFVNAYLGARLSSSVMFRFRTRVLDAFLGSTWETQTQQEQASLQLLIGTNVGNLTAMVQQAASMSSSLFGFLTFVVSAFLISPVVALALVLFGMLLFAVLRPLNTIVKRKASTQRDFNREFSRVLEEGVSVSLELRVFGVERSLHERLRGNMRQLVRARNAQQTMGALSPHIYQSAGLLTILLGIGVVSTYGVGDLAVVGALVLLMIRGLSYGQALQATYTATVSSIPYVSSLLETLQEFENEPQPRGLRSPAGPITLSLVKVECGYRSKSVLEDVNLAVEPGEAIGIVGSSGAGKSTLAALVMGLIEPRSGSFTIGGVECRDVDRRWWARNVSFVPQEPKLIEGTVADNIRFMREEISDEEVRAAAIAAHLSAELESWPNGLAHDVGPKGSRLSGGQKQRICIARALVTNPKILVLDEPTSALDATAEESISEVLRELRGKTMLLIIAHRLSTIQMCDRVLRIGDGRVVEVDGTTINYLSAEDQSDEPVDQTVPHL